MSNILKSFLQFQQQLRLYHWNTRKYPRHIASGDLYKKIDELIDKFIETLQGQNGRIEYRKIVLSLRSINDKNILDTMKQFNVFLNRLDISNDLKNIRDEMVGTVNQTIYLFSLD